MAANSSQPASSIEAVTQQLSSLTLSSLLQNQAEKPKPLCPASKSAAHDARHLQRVTQHFSQAQDARRAAIEAKRPTLSATKPTAAAGDKPPTSDVKTVAELIKTSDLLRSPILDDLARRLKVANTMLQLESVEDQLTGMIYMRKCVSVESSPPISEVVATGCLPRVVHLLNTSTAEELKFEAAWVITNIASGTSEHCLQVVNTGGLKAFVNIMKTTTSENLMEQVIWGLGNIAGDSPAFRDKLNEMSLIEIMVSKLDSFKKYVFFIFYFKKKKKIII